jgi:hypothetical protein
MEMRAILVASLMGLGIVLVGTSPGAAVPANGASGIANGLAQHRMADPVHWRRHHGHHHHGVHRHHHWQHHNHRHHPRHHRHCWWHRGHLHCGGW